MFEDYDTTTALTDPTLSMDDTAFDDRLRRESLFPCLTSLGTPSFKTWNARTGDLHRARGWQTYSTYN